MPSGSCRCVRVLEMPKFWVIEPDPIVETALRALRRQLVLNAHDIDAAIRAFFASLPGDSPWPDPLPADFPAPVLMLPDDPALHPDYFVWEGERFVSDRLRRTLNLPDDAASWVECEVVAAPTGRPRYWLFRSRVAHPVVDLRHSAIRLTSHVSAKTGARGQLVNGVKALKFVDGFTPRSPVLIDRTIDNAKLLATDAVARAVIAADCTGLVFVHPMWVIPGASTGVVLGRTGFERRFYDDAQTRVADVHLVDPEVADRGDPTA